MQHRHAEDRRRRILEQARSGGHVAVTDIAAELDVAAETIRRDLKVLEDHGLVRRTHGGAYPVESAGFETSISHRSESRVAEKRRIAAATLELLGPAETMFLDEGFTPLLIAEAVAASGRPMTVVTASLAGASALAASPAIDVIVLGGRLRSRTMGTVDHWTTDMLSHFVLDVAVLGSNGITRERGLTVPSTAVGAVKAKAVQVSRRRIFAGVHTKFGVTSFCKFAEVSEFEALVTDTTLSSHEAHRYSALGPHVVRA